jgi:Flp pilus assembly pilin Flp
VEVIVLLRTLVRIQTRSVRYRSERGQTTAEYALVLVGVAAIALLVVAWAGDTNKIGRLLDGVLDSILDKIP